VTFGTADNLAGATLAGFDLPAGGIAALVAGLTAPAIVLVGIGAVATFIAAGMLAPTVARPMSSALGRPLAALLGTPGRLGRENSMRSPRRTAQTAAALMVGIGLVSAIAVLGASLSQSAKTNLDSAVTAEDIITGPSSGFSPVGFLVLAALLGLAAASWPSRRAAKFDVLAAIAVE
jgi:putative ABC transport system permease protein